MEKQKKYRLYCTGRTSKRGKVHVDESSDWTKELRSHQERPQTTRNQIRTVYTDERGQAVFLDTPGDP